MKESFSHLANLIALIYEDGKLDKKELDLLYRIAGRYGIEEDEVIKILNQQIDFDFIIPETQEEKIKQLNDLIKMMMIDGNINPGEKELIRKIAFKFEVDDQTLNQLIDKFKK